MKIEKSKIKLWSTIGSRATFGLIALELAKSINNLMILTSDVSTSAGLDRFKVKFPDKYLDVGIAEQNLIGIAAGLSSEGMNVFTTTFSPFQTMRCCEQIKVNLGYMRHKVNMVGLASGVVLGTLGYTHCCIEDVSIMRSIPNITVISPADCFETLKATLACVNHKESVYIRLTGGAKNQSVYKQDYDYIIGQAVTLREGVDITIIAAGTMVYKSLLAADILLEQGISSTVVNMHTIKPIDKMAIEEACNSSLIVSVEEHNVIGGLGSAIAEHKSSLKRSPKQLLLGVKDIYTKGGDYKFLQDKHRLTPDKIVEDILLHIE